MAQARIFASLNSAPRWGMPDKYYESRFPQRAPHGPGCFINQHGNLPAEYAARNLLNNADPRVAENRMRLVTYGGKGRFARTWFDASDLLYRLSELRPGQQLQVQSGAFSSIVNLPGSGTSVMIANSNLIGSHDTQEHELALEQLGLMMYGQYTAGSWIYIGTQGILQGTYYTFAEAARKLTGLPSLKGMKILTAGCGAMSGAQPLAATMGGGAILVVEPRIAAMQKRLGFKQLDVIVTAEEGLEKAIRLVDEAAAKGQSLSVGFEGNAGTVYPELIKRGWIPDIVTEQTPAHDYYKYLPDQLPIEAADRLSSGTTPEQRRYFELASDTLSRHINAMLEFQTQGAYVFDYGTGARRWAKEIGVPVVREDGHYVYPGFVEDLIRTGYFSEGCGPFRFIAYNGQPALRQYENILLRSLQEDRHELMHSWLRLARTLKPQGTASRILWLNYQDRATAAELFHELMAANPELGHIGIGRDMLDVGGAASLERCTEGLPGGAIADWVMLGAMGAVSLGADVVAMHGGGGTGMGNSRTYGYTLFLTGTQDSIDRTRNVLLFDPAQGIGRLHAENVEGTHGPVAAINAAGYMQIPPYRDRKGLVPNR